MNCRCEEPGLDDENTIKSAHDFFTRKGLTLAAAESCTGGLISHYLTMFPGASSFFKAGLVTYSNEMKREVIGVAPEILEKYGAVSEETARAMAERTRMITRTDCAVAATGNLGPDALEGKDRGLVYIAVSKKGGTFVRELRLEGDRPANKAEAALAALRFVMEVMGSSS